ncbi:hypothetical protein NUW54_g13593 [Trametes sanguinea]|uniref:Uncharacterized protein n=1 Tax=Trametes sanguinea TaxID=158606 RepID=A0ACC1MLK2_9APHY|nr:hypothetical protein NUW54_g13593 [Trametes sanguinea]
MSTYNKKYTHRPMQYNAAFEPSFIDAIRLQSLRLDRLRQLLTEQVLGLDPHPRRLAVRQLEQRRQQGLTELLRRFPRKERRQVIDRDDREWWVTLAIEDRKRVVRVRRVATDVNHHAQPPVLPSGSDLLLGQEGGMGELR